MRKELLIVSYNFPPVMSAGVNRLKGLTKYLERSGWNISVITIKKSYVEKSNSFSSGDFEGGVSIVRAQSLEIDRFNPRRILNKEKSSPEGEDYHAGTMKKFIVGLLRYPYAFLHKILSFPDRQVGWLFPLLLSLIKAVGKGNSRLVLSSSPPHSSHLPVLLLKCFYRFHWVVDFRDPWTVPPYYYNNRLSLSMARALEKLVLRKSDRIIANTPGNKEALLKEFPFINDKKITVITNGYDTELNVSHIETNVNESGLDILYLGEVYEGMLDLYLDALRVMIAKNLERIPRLGIYGSINPSYYRQFQDNAVRDHLLYEGRVSFEKSIALMKRAKALLLVLPHSDRGRTWVPSKLYAYLFSGKPILAIGPEGDALRIIESCRAGVTVRNTDPEMVAGEITRFMNLIDQCEIDSRAEDMISSYSMENIALQLDAILREEAELLK